MSGLWRVGSARENSTDFGANKKTQLIMDKKEELNRLAKLCLHFGDYSFMLNEIIIGNVVEKPTSFGRLVMSKVIKPEFLEMDSHDWISDELKLNETWSAIEVQDMGCYIFSETECYYITRN